MGELQSSLDALAAEDLSGMFGPQLLEVLGEALRSRNRLDAFITRVVREGEKAGAAEFDGLKTMPAWLRGHARLSPAAAGRIVRSGRALEHLPAVAEAFAAGDVTAEQVAVITPIAAGEALTAANAQSVDLGEVDRAMVTVATTEAHQRLGEVVHRYLDALDPDGPEPDLTEGRRLTIAKHADGSITGRFDLDAVGGEKVQAALESIVQASRPKGDMRTRAQQQADALVQLADNALAQGDLPFLRTVKPHVVLTIGVEDLVDPSRNPGAAETGFGATLSAARARWVACDATVRRMVLDADGLPLDVGREKRVVPPHLRRAVEKRDRHCVFAGCGAPTHWCDVHHRLEWINGGRTSLENSALLCERHHTKVHHGFRVEQQPDGQWRTYRPDGTEILIHPRV
ncbi:DUF222 domain-containing protein [Modestobacter sp. I12A-02662]|uniref:HNH endonuclease signature motif containing protein n=1 Tax=Modestobacter sp. I12A-02662 TaxID=1730496 RepID=UPI0034DE43AC